MWSDRWKEEQTVSMDVEVDSEWALNTCIAVSSDWSSALDLPE